MQQLLLWNYLKPGKKCAAQVATSKWAEPSARLSTGAKVCTDPVPAVPAAPTLLPVHGAPCQGHGQLAPTWNWAISQLWVFFQPMYWHSGYWGQNHSARQLKVGVFYSCPIPCVLLRMQSLLEHEVNKKSCAAVTPVRGNSQIVFAVKTDWYS